MPRAPAGCAVTLRVTFAGPLGGLIAALAPSLTREYVEREARGLRGRCERA